MLISLCLGAGQSPQKRFFKYPSGRSNPGHKYSGITSLCFQCSTHDFGWTCSLQSGHAPDNQSAVSARIGRVRPLAPRVTKRIKCFANSFQEILLSLAPSSSSFPLPVIWGFSNVHQAISCFPQLISSNLNFFYLLSHFTTHSSDFQMIKFYCFTSSPILPSVQFYTSFYFQRFLTGIGIRVNVRLIFSFRASE